LRSKKYTDFNDQLNRRPPIGFFISTSHSEKTERTKLPPALYGRTAADLYLEGRWINLELVAEGWHS